MDTSETYEKLSDEASPLEPDYIVERVKWYEDPIYIKMCEKAEEIQAGHKFQIGNIYYMPKDGECAIFVSDNRDYMVFANIKTGTSFAFDDPYIWLPFQHQLQEMCGYSSLEQLARHFHDFIGWMDGLFRVYSSQFSSMEQLWLAFVMKEKYNRVWDGENWIKG